MLILKRKEIVAAALVALIGVAGYLNWSYQDTVRVKDGDSYIETGKKLGEAELVKSSPTPAPSDKDAAAEKSEKAAADDKSTAAPDSEKKTGSDKNANTDYFAAAKLEKQNSRSKAIEILNSTAENQSFDADIRKQAQEELLNMAAITEKETVTENLARAKGYPDICVYVNDDMVNITVKKEGFSESDAAKITEIAVEQLNFSPKNIKIVEVS